MVTADNADDWVGETDESIAARLEGAKSAETQMRLTVATMAVISVMMLIAAYNAYLSYDYNWIVNAGDEHLAADKPSELLKAQALKDWASARTVQISLIGIRVSVDDAAVLGSAVLLVISLWFVLIARLENNTVGSLLRHTDTVRATSTTEGDQTQMAAYSKGQRWLILHSLTSNNLFMMCDPELLCIDRLSEQPAESATSARRLRIWLDRAGFTLLRDFLFLFPASASLAVFLIDRRSYFIPDPFTEDFRAPGIEPFYWRSMWVFIACWIPLTMCCWRASVYSKATEQAIREYEKKLKEEPPA
jgi:hypothetical protein